MSLGDAAISREQNGTVSPPSGIIAVAPGGRLAGESRFGVLEVKAGPNNLIVWGEPGARVLLTDGRTGPIEEWHVTVHRDLMVHARSPDRRSTIQLLPAQLVQDTAVLLLAVATAPEAYRTMTGPQQREWNGALIVSPLADHSYDPNRTTLRLDVWAVPRGSEAMPLPPSAPDARPAWSWTERLLFGPVAADHAFREGVPPSCDFYYSFWWAESDYRCPTLAAPGTRMEL